MRPGRTKKIFGTGLIVLCLAGMAYAPATSAKSEAQPGVGVGVHAQHSGDKVIYYYRVTNNTSQSITAVTVGRDRRDNGDQVNDIYELTELPSGWNPKFGIPTTSYNAPTGWRTGLDSSNDGGADNAMGSHSITWEPLNEKSPKLFSGQSMSRLSITVDNPDPHYLNGHALLTFAEGNPPMVVPVYQLDNTPPVLAVNLSPDTIMPLGNETMNPELDRRTVAVKASFSVQDDFDRMPRIKLESVTANEPAGNDDILDASPGLDDRYIKFRADHPGTANRIYTVMYSATDASGNQTLSSATVTVVPASPPVAEPAPSPAPPAAPD